MDLLQIIKLVSIPRAVKFFSLAIIAVFMGLAIYAIFGGAHLAEGSILQAGMGLLGILLPLAIAIIFLSFYEAGVQPLKNATEKFLLQLVPEALSHVLSGSGEKDGVRVAATYIPEHICRYLVELPGKKLLRLEVELNVKKVSVVFFFSGHSTSFSDVERGMEHTLSGAIRESYEINRVLSRKEWDGVTYDFLVLYKSLAPDFLWNSAEKLYFVQDLRVMFSSAIREASHLLLQEDVRDQ